MSLMATLIGLPAHSAVSCMLSNQTFATTLAFPRTESKAADRAAIEKRSFRDVTYPVTPRVEDSALTRKLWWRSSIRRVVVSQ